MLSTITLTILADDTPELSEVVTVTLTNITTEGVGDPAKGATIDLQRHKSLITTLASDYPYGLVGWHTGSLFTRVVEPTGKCCEPCLGLQGEVWLYGVILALTRMQIFMWPFHFGGQ